MEISKLNRTKMKDVDGSDNIRYSAILNGEKLIQYATDGIFHKHLTLQEWENYIKIMLEEQNEIKSKS